MEELIKKWIRDIPDFPKPGIVFKDITPLLGNPDLFSKVVEVFAKRYQEKKVQAVVAIESRGFLFGAPLALRLGIPLVPVRKKGKLPFKTHEVSYNLEYGSATVEVHVDAIVQGHRVVVIDDLLATGGTAEAACKLIEKSGGEVVECAFVIELGFLHGRDRVAHAPVHSLVQYN